MPKTVVFSSRAFTSILVETQEKIKTETGGVFLGYRKDDVWFVIESIDPGPKSIFRPTYFEYDQQYINHLINKISRLYKEQLDLIGLWHRHPGSFDKFSSTDDGTNTSYAQMSEMGAISALVNIDPQFRLTVYSVSLPLKYEKIPYVVGDEYIPSELLKLKDPRKIKNILSSPSFWSSQKRKTDKIQDYKNERTEFSLSQVIYHFLESRSYGNVDSSSVSLEKDHTEGLELILENLEDDLHFLTSVGISCDMSLSPSSQVLLKEETKEVATPPSLELVFGTKGNDVLFSFNEVSYKYYPGLIKEAYIEYLSKEGGRK